MTIKDWIPALRIARREARKAKGRSALVLAMIGLPVAFLAFAAVSFDMFRLTPQERIDRNLGNAEALIRWYGPAPVRQSADGSSWGSPDWRPADAQEQEATHGEAELLAHLPPGTRALPVESARLKLRTPDGIANTEARISDIADPMLGGIVSILEGRAPAAADQIAVNPAAARWLDVRVGGVVKTVDPDRTFTVTAIVEYPENLRPVVVIPPAAQDPTRSQPAQTWLVDTPSPIDWNQVQQLNKSGMVVVSRTVLLDPPPAVAPEFGPGETNTRELALGGVIAGLAVLEIILLAGPAFAVGARRRTRDLALVAAAGGEPRQLRRIVLADGIVLGLAGAVAGLALGVVLAVAGRPLIEEHLAQQRAGGYRFFVLALLGIAAMAVVTGLLAAAVPAFTAARQHVVQALTGRRGITRSRKRWLFLGIGMVASGAAIATFGALRISSTYILMGVVLGELGLVLITPALIGLVARLGRWLPLSPRLALRDTARNRASAAPAISAVMAAVAGAVAVGVYLAGQQQQRALEYQPNLPIGHVLVQHYAGLQERPLDWTAAGNLIRSVLPDARIYRPMAPGCAAGSQDESCSIMAVVPKEHRCPYHELDRVPNPEEIKAARKDPRCQALNLMGGSIVVDDGTALPALSKADPALLAKARDVLARGGAVVNDPRLVKDGRVTFSVLIGEITKESIEDLPTLVVEGYLLEDLPGAWAVVSPKALASVNLGSRAEGMVVATDAMPTAAQEERLNLLMRNLDSDVFIHVERGPRTGGEPMGIVLAIAAALIALGAAGIATGLTAADSRADLGTLAAVGAAPRVRRRLSLSQAGVISGLGAGLGTLTGLGAAAVLVIALNSSYEQRWMAPPPMPLVVPWDSVAVIIAVPLLAMAGAGLLTRSRLPIERRL